MPDYQKELVEYRLQTAKEKLHSAQVLLEAGEYKDSIGRSYYADFFLVSRSDAEEQYKKAEKFLDAVKQYLESI